MWNILCIGMFMQRGITTSNGYHKIIGKGPPVLLSSGFYGTMPSFMYNDLIHKLKANLTLVLPNGKPIKSKTVDEMKEVLNVDKIGFLSHSSFDDSILENKNVEKAVVIDPISFPTIELSLPFLHPKQTSPVMDTLLIETELSKTKLIYEKFQMRIDSNSVLRYEKFGHGDILDDMWADILNKLGIKGASKTLPINEFQSFNSWKFDKNAVSFKDVRKQYRLEISEEIVKHFLPQTKFLLN